MRVILICATLLAPSYAIADINARGFNFGSDLNIMCSSEAVGDRWSCFGYIIGALDAMFLLNAKATSCIPRNVSQLQLVEVVKSWLERNPQHWHLPAAALANNAVVAAFPCE